MGELIEHDFGHVQPEDEGHQPSLMDTALCTHLKNRMVLVAVCKECGAETEVAKDIYP